MDYFVYLHQRKKYMIILTSEGEQVAVTDINPGTASLHAAAKTELAKLGFSLITAWGEFGYYSYAEVKKKKLWLSGHPGAGDAGSSCPWERAPRGKPVIVVR